MYAKKYNNDELSSIGVYRITTPSGKIYVGMTTQSFATRWEQHHRYLRSKSHICTGLQNAFNKYGWNNLTLEILTSYFVSEDNTIDVIQYKILKEEKLQWIRCVNSGFYMLNGCPTGTGSVLHTAESRAKIGLTIKEINKNKNVCKIYYNYCIDCNKLLCSNSKLTKRCDNCKIITQIVKGKGYCKIFYNNCLKCNALFTCARRSIVYCSKCDLTFKIKNSSTYTIPSSEYDDIISKYLNGDSTILIGYFYGVNCDTIRTILNKNNIKCRDSFQGQNLYYKRNNDIKFTYSRTTCRYCNNDYSINSIWKHEKLCSLKNTCCKCNLKVHKKNSKYCHMHYNEKLL